MTHERPKERRAGVPRLLRVTDTPRRHQAYRQSGCKLGTQALINLLASGAVVRERGARTRAAGPIELEFKAWLRRQRRAPALAHWLSWGPCIGRAFGCYMDATPHPPA